MTEQTPHVAVRLADPNGDRLVINDDEGRAVVTVRSDGSVEYAPECDLDAASRRFWEALARAFPGPWIA